MDIQPDQPREDHDDEFLGVVLPELRDGDAVDHLEAESLIRDHVRKHMKPLRWD